MYRNPAEMVNASANTYPVDFLGAKEIDPRVKYFKKGVTTNQDIRNEHGLLRVEEFRKKTDKNIVDLSSILPFIEAMTRFLEKNRKQEDNGHVNFDPPEGFVGKIVQICREGFEVAVRPLALEQVELNFFAFFTHVEPFTEGDLFVRWYRDLPMGVNRNEFGTGRGLDLEQIARKNHLWALWVRAYCGTLPRAEVLDLVAKIKQLFVPGIDDAWVARAEEILRLGEKNESDAWGAAQAMWALDVFAREFFEEIAASIVRASRKAGETLNSIGEVDFPYPRLVVEAQSLVLSLQKAHGRFSAFEELVKQDGAGSLIGYVQKPIFEASTVLDSMKEKLVLLEVQERERIEALQLLAAAASQKTLSAPRHLLEGAS